MGGSKSKAKRGDREGPRHGCPNSSPKTTPAAASKQPEVTDTESEDEPVTLNTIYSIYNVKNWDVLATYKVNAWSEKYLQGRMNFDVDIDLKQDLDTRWQPWVSGGHYYEVKIPSSQYDWPDCEEQMPPDLPVQYIHGTMSVQETEGSRLSDFSLPQSYYHRMVQIDLQQVIGKRDNTLLIQVASWEKSSKRPGTLGFKMDFYLVDFNEFGQDLATLVLTMDSHDLSMSTPCLYEGAISKDCSCILLKPNPTFAHMHHVTGIRDEVLMGVRLLHDSWHKFSLETNALECTFAFDPRYKHSRVVVANVVLNNKRQLQVVDVDSCELLQSSDLVPSAAHLAQTVSFSPDGLLITALMRLGVNSAAAPFFLADVRVYSSDSLQCVHIIRQPDWKPNGYKTLTPSAIFPLFNTSGQMLAVGEGLPLRNSSLNDLHCIKVLKVPPSLNLKVTCRRRIRAWVRRDDLPLLPMPDLLIRYLLFEPSQP